MGCSRSAVSGGCRFAKVVRKHTCNFMWQVIEVEGGQERSCDSVLLNTDGEWVVELYLGIMSFFHWLIFILANFVFFFDYFTE